MYDTSLLNESSAKQSQKGIANHFQASVEQYTAAAQGREP